MPYFKPHTYVNGAILNASDQDSNDSEAKVYINQEIVQADYATAAFTTADFQRGELDPIVNHHQFTTGEIWGRFNDSSILRDRSYFTAHTKTNDDLQTSATAKQYQALYECGDTFVLEHDGSIFFTFGAQLISEENLTNTNGQWDSRVYLMQVQPGAPQPSDIQGTRTYSFEEFLSVAPPAGTRDPGSEFYNPFSSLPIAREQTNQNRRWTQWQWMVNNLPAGTYKYYVAINPKVEEGYSSARQYTAEVFYDEKYVEEIEGGQ